MTSSALAPTAAPMARPAVQRRGAYPWLRVSVALLLIAAAALKGYQAATEPVADRLWVVVQVQLEWLLGLWLLSGLVPRLAWLVTLLCFAGFGAVTLYKGIHGEASCGCFGKVQLSPWYTLILDVLVIVCLLRWRPGTRSSSLRGATRWFGVLAIAAVGAVPSTQLMLNYEPGRLDVDSQIRGDSRHVLLEPKQWVGKQLALLPHIDIGGQLGEGKWLLLFHRHDCPSCRQFLTQWEQSAPRLLAEQEGLRLAMIEIPPYGPALLAGGVSQHARLRGRLDASRQWLMTAPTLVLLDGGKVLEVREGVVEPPATAPATQPAAPPVVVPATQPLCDLGYVEPGSVHQIVFKIANDTAQPLEIRNAVSECSCAAVRDWPRSIPPGQSGDLLVSFTVPAEAMAYAKSIALVLADPQREPRKWEIRARIGLPLRGQAAALDFGVLEGGQTASREITILNEGNTPVRMLYSTSTDPGCVVAVPREAAGAQSRLTLTARLRPSGDKGPGFHSGTLQLHTDVRDQPVLEMPFTYTIAGR